MALVSPGVEVQVVDESAYGAPGAGTVPLLLVATFVVIQLLFFVLL